MPGYAELKQSLLGQGSGGYADLKQRLLGPQIPASEAPNPALAPAPASTLAPPPMPFMGQQQAQNIPPAGLDPRLDPAVASISDGRGTYAQPPPSALSQALDPYLAFSSGVVSGASLGVMDPVLRAINPEIEKIQGRNKGITTVGRFAGELAPIGGAIKAAARAVPAVGAAGAEALGFGAYEVARDRDPAAFVPGFAMGAGFAGLTRGAGAVARDAYRTVLPEGLPEIGRYRGAPPVKPRISVPSSAVPTTPVPPPIEPPRELGKTEAQAFPETADFPVQGKPPVQETRTAPVAEQPAVPLREGVPLRDGMRVSGEYDGFPFSGSIKGVRYIEHSRYAPPSSGEAVIVLDKPITGPFGSEITRDRLLASTGTDFKLKDSRYYGKPTAQPPAPVAESPEALFERAKPVQQSLEADLDAVHQELGLKSKWVGGQKSVESIADKQARRLAQKDDRPLSDLARGSVMADNTGQFDQVAEALTKKGYVPDPQYGQARIGGYKAYHFEKAVDGINTEIQIHTPEISKFKFGESDAFYHKWRTNVAKGLTPEEQALFKKEADELSAKWAKVYEDAGLSEPVSRATSASDIKVASSQPAGSELVSDQAPSLKSRQGVESNENISPLGSRKNLTVAIPSKPPLPHPNNTPTAGISQAEKSAAPPTPTLKVHDVPLSELKVDPERFQNRATEFSERTAASVAERFDPNKFGTLKVWVDPKTGEKFVISGHSRFEGLKRRGAETAPVQIIKGTEQEAIDFAKIEANRKGTKETLSESIEAYKRARDRGFTKAKLKDTFEGEVDYLEAFSYLNGKGKFVEVLNQPAASEFPYIKRTARWVGDLRKAYPKLTDAHERQVFDFLYEPAKRNYEMGKDKFFALIDKQAGDLGFDASKALVLKKSAEVVTGAAARSDTGPLVRRIQELKELQKEARTTEEFEALRTEIDKLQSGVRTLQRDQGDIFSQPTPKPAAKPPEPVPATRTPAQPLVPKSGTVVPEKGTQTVPKAVSRTPKKALPSPEAGSGVQAPPEPLPNPTVKLEEPALKAERDALVKQGVPRETAHDQTVGIAKRDVEQFYNDYPELGKVDPVKRRSFSVSISNAKKAGLDKNADALAESIIETKRVISDEESAALLLRKAELKKLAKEYNDEWARLDKEGNRAAAEDAYARRNAVLAQEERIHAAAQFGRREVALALSIGGARLDKESLDIVNVLREARYAKGKRLTLQEETAYTELVGRFEAAQKQLGEVEANYTKALAEAERLKAEQVVAREAAKEKITSVARTKRANLKTERDQILKKLGAMGYTLNSGVDPNVLYLVGKLGVNYIREGAVTLEEVVKKVLVDLPSLTERDVHEALNTRNPKAQTRARTDVEKRIAQLKTQARLLTDIEKAERGIFNKRRQRPPEPGEIKALRAKLRDLRGAAYRSGVDPARLERAVQTLNSLQDQLANHYRPLKKSPPMVPAEVKEIRDQIAVIRRALKTEDDLADLTEQLRTGEFKVRQREPAAELPPDLERKRVAVAEARKAIRRKIQEAKPKTGADRFMSVVELSRTNRATADMSMTFRQGLIPASRTLFTDPAAFTKVNAKAMKASINKYTAGEVDAWIRSQPRFYLGQRAGLDIVEVGAKGPAGSELFNSSLAEKIPVWGEVVKGSERHAVTYLNLMRWLRFDHFLDLAPNATKEELAAMARWVNVSSGRGDLTKLGPTTLKALSTIYFAPRFSASRVQAPWLLWRYRNLPRVRSEIIKDMTSTVALGMGVLTAASWAGMEVGTNIDDADWGKIRVGNTTIDIWGGFQQPARVIGRIGKTGLQASGALDSQVDIDPVELIERFSSYKAGPLVTLPRELVTGKTAVGEPVTWNQSLINHMLPFIYQDIRDAYNDTGIGRAALVGGLAFVGVGANTYQRGGGNSPFLPDIHRPKLPSLPGPH